MSTSKRQSILQEILDVLFGTDRSMISVDSDNLDGDQKQYSKMLTRRGVNKSVSISKDPDRKSLIFKIK